MENEQGKKARPRMGERDRIIGDRVRRARRMRGVTQEALARRMGISPQQLQKYESGINKISASRIEIAADALSVSVTVFFDTPLPGKMFSRSLDTADDRHSVRLLQMYKGIASERLRKLLLHTARVLAEEEAGRYATVSPPELP